MTGPSEVSVLLAGVREGDRDAFDALFVLVYEELKARARFHLTSGGRGTLATTVLVHEAYLKLAAASERDWESRRHFYRVAGRAMRQILVDRARRRRAEKRGGGRAAVDLEAVEVPAPEDASDRMLALEEALSRLSEESPEAAHVMELTWIVGLSVEEAAELTGASTRTVKRHRRFARAFMHDHLMGSRGVADGGAEGGE